MHSHFTRLCRIHLWHANGAVARIHLHVFGTPRILIIVSLFSSLAVDHNYWALILILFPILTLFGNILVILSVCRERSLQTVTNYFIVSLAIADLLVAVVVMPFAVYFLVSVLAGRTPESCQNQNAECKIAVHLPLILSSVWGAI